MTLARRATDALDIEGLDDLLLGPTGLAFADGDPVGAAKVLKDFSRDHDVFVVKGGLLGSDFLSPEKISELADIEPRDVLLAKIAGAMKAPMANMAGLLAALPRNTASVLQQLLEQKQSEAPEEDTTSDASAAEVADEPGDEPAETDAPDEAEVADEADAPPADETEDDDATATVEASDDATDETENEEGAPSDDDATDEASDDDAEEK